MTRQNYLKDIEMTLNKVREARLECIKDEIAKKLNVEKEELFEEGCDLDVLERYKDAEDTMFSIERLIKRRYLLYKKRKEMWE